MSSHPLPSPPTHQQAQQSRLGSEGLPAGQRNRSAGGRAISSAWHNDRCSARFVRERRSTAGLDTVATGGDSPRP